MLVERAEGLYEPREVKTGTRGDGYIAIREGVKEGERVVVSANFLIDAESNLKAALSGFGSSKPAADPVASSPRTSPTDAAGPGADKGHAGHGSGR